ncbi:hypothetical protein YC2023_043586 [Brassica napus]
MRTTKYSCIFSWHTGGSHEYPDLSPTIPPRPIGTGKSWRPNGNYVKSAVAGTRTRDGGHLSRGSFTTRPRGPVREGKNQFVVKDEIMDLIGVLIGNLKNKHSGGTSKTFVVIFSTYTNE